MEKWKNEMLEKCDNNISTDNFKRFLISFGMTNINMNKNGSMIGGKAANHTTPKKLAVVILSGTTWSEESVA